MQALDMNTVAQGNTKDRRLEPGFGGSAFSVMILAS
jgi:hypothetical protein